MCVQNYYLYKAAWVNVFICVTFFVFFSCCSWLTTLGGSIPHGVFLESGGNTVGLTQHRPGKEGRHVPPCSPATTPLTTIASVSERTNSAGPQGPPSALSKGKGGKRGSVTWAPEPSCEFDPQSGTKMASEPGINLNIKMPNESCSNLNNKIGFKPDMNSITKLGFEPGTNLDTTMDTALGTNSDTKSNAEPGTNSNANTNTSRPMAEQVPYPSADRVMEPITKLATEVLEKCKSSIESSSEQERKQENGNGCRGSGEEMEWESTSSTQYWFYGWLHVFKFLSAEMSFFFVLLALALQLFSLVWNF